MMNEEKSFEHLSDISYYNHNYYRINPPINGYDVVYVECDELDNAYEITLGNVREGEFISSSMTDFESCAHVGYKDIEIITYVYNEFCI